jgi:hypothetical protein
MAVDIMQTLVEILCPQNPMITNAASTCNQFISSHAAYGEFGQLLYFLFFPTIFIILFIYILTTFVLPGAGPKKGLRMLIAAAVYIFIIINGMYSIVLPISEIWFIVIIFLFGLWYFVRHHFGGGGGGGGRGVMPGLGGGMVSGAMRRIQKQYITKETPALEREVNLKLQELEGIRNATRHNPDAWKGYTASSAAAWAVLNQYKAEISIGGIPIGGKLGELTRKLEKTITELDQEYRKKGSKAA